LCRDLLKSFPCPHPIVIMREARLDIMQSLLLYIYRGETSVRAADLPEFLTIAKYFKISGKTIFSCLRFIDNINRFTARNMLTPAALPALGKSFRPVRRKNSAAEKKIRPR
jgi:hypothetical protein